MQLHKLNAGCEEHKTNTKASHLLYMGYLKLICKTEEEVQKQMQVVRTFSDANHMQFGLEKCNIVLRKEK